MFTAGAGCSALLELAEPRYEDPDFATGPQLAATFDGRYLVIAGYGFGTFLRHDPRNADQFTQPAGWESFDSRGFGASALVYSAAASLDRASYFAAINGTRPFLRHGGGDSFDAGWQTFDPPDSGTGGLPCTVGRIATTSGPYVYFGPTGLGTTPSCVVRPTRPVRRPSSTSGTTPAVPTTIPPPGAPPRARRSGSRRRATRGRSSTARTSTTLAFSPSAAPTSR